LSEPSRPAIDRRAARRRFERAAARYAGRAWLEAEVGARMLERLDYVKIAPRRVLDAGSGPAQFAARLRARYPRSELIALDFSHAMLLAARGRALSRLLGRAVRHAVCADLESLPLAPSSVDLIWCNMALHWVNDPLAVLRGFQRALAVEGLLMFSTLGPDTLKELRAAAGEQRVHRFIDMHDLGDMLVAAGFSDPVMDMEMLTVSYCDPQTLLSDLRATGQTSVRGDRPRGLAGKRFAAGLRTRLAGSQHASYEVVYGHAWKGAPKSDAQGRAIVRFEPSRRKAAAR
jgi:malonyl-CoA O-methyltransferase